MLLRAMLRAVRNVNLPDANVRCLAERLQLSYATPVAIAPETTDARWPISVVTFWLRAGPIIYCTASTGVQQLAAARLRATITEIVFRCGWSVFDSMRTPRHVFGESPWVTAAFRK